MMNEPVSTIMTRDLITVMPIHTLKTVRELFRKNRIHHLPVIDEYHHLLGLVTTYDLFKLGKSVEDYEEIPVSEIMTTKVATLEPSDKVGTACEVFLQNLFHALPVIENGKLIGLVTTFDVLKYTHQKEYPNQQPI
jgi:CBS domain-containing protein